MPHKRKTNHKPPIIFDSENTLEERILLDELTGHTNKTPDSVRADLERKLAAQKSAPNLKENPTPANPLWVAITECVTDALRNLLATNEFPIDPLTIDWMEAEVAEFNGVAAERIAADCSLIEYGKTWFHHPESARVNTGFTYWPEDK